MRLSALQRKLLRDIWLIRGQALAIALVIAAGVTMFVLMISAFDSLDLTQRTYYERYRFADVFASLKRAPRHLEQDLAAIPGVARVDTRVVAGVNLELDGVEQPVTGRLISIPERRQSMLCDLYLRRGRYIDPGRPDEVLVRESFAVANNLDLGDTVAAVINGRRQELRIVGFALSPEFVYAIRPGELIADDRLFGLFWMGERALASAFDMDGGFNDVLLALDRDASTPGVISRLDRLLEPYGGFGAVPRALQPSHFFLQSELDGLQVFGTALPVVFLGVAALLLNVVLSRMFTVQREQIAVLKALGYSNGAVGWHYLQWSLVIAVAGAALGLGLGAWLGAGMTRLYTEFFRFPILIYRLAPSVMTEAVAISLGAAVLGAWAAVRRVVRLPPAVAMRPESPARYRESWLERAGARRWISQPTRMILRNLQRHPGRVAVSVGGIAVGGALLVVGTFSIDSMNYMLDLQFNVAQRYDAMITFIEPASARAYYEVRNLPGVSSVEPFRTVPVRLGFRHRSRNTAITGLRTSASLNRVVSGPTRIVPMPPDGLVLSSKLAEILGASVGDLLHVEVLVQSRPVRDVRIVEVIDDYMGTNAYMEINAMHAMLGEGATLSGAYLSIDAAAAPALFRAVKATPAVAAVALKDQTRISLEQTVAESFVMVRGVSVLFAVVVAFGVVYNTARIALSERSRELATLRVIGFRRNEIAYIMLGELGLITVVALPLVLLIGYGMAAATVTLYETEVYRLPLAVSRSTFGLAIVTVVVSSAASGLLVWRKLQRLDLIAVLKTRE